MDSKTPLYTSTKTGVFEGSQTFTKRGEKKENRGLLKGGKAKQFWNSGPAKGGNLNKLNTKKRKGGKKKTGGKKTKCV